MCLKLRHTELEFEEHIIFHVEICNFSALINAINEVLSSVSEVFLHVGFHCNIAVELSQIWSHSGYACL